MANFPKINLTNAGLSLLTKVQGGTDNLTFTKAVLGDGKIGTTPISTLTSLVSPKIECAINEGKYVSTGNYQIGAFFSNTTVTTGFWWREIGIYAKGNDGIEILYSYSNAGDAGDYIPVGSDKRVEKYIYVSLAIGNAENVTVEIGSSDTFIIAAEKGKANGIATLGSDGKIPSEQLPAMDFVTITDFNNHNHVNANGGFEHGTNATATSGGAIGNGAIATTGGAVGDLALAGAGFSGGYGAQVYTDSINIIDAIQLGTGTNSNEKTLQVYDYQLMDANGNIPVGRLGNAPKTEVVDNLTSTYTTKALSANQGKKLKSLVDSKADNQTSDGGFAGGNNANATLGGAIGNGAIATTGGAVGDLALAGAGFSGGYGAQVYTDSINIIDAIQLGTGTNSNEKTLQVYDYKLMDANGKIPVDRLPAHSVWKLLADKTYTATFTAAMYEGEAFEITGIDFASYDEIKFLLYISISLPANPKESRSCQISFGTSTSASANTGTYILCARLPQESGASAITLSENASLTLYAQKYNDYLMYANQYSGTPITLIKENGSLYLRAFMANGATTTTGDATLNITMSIYGKEAIV